MSGSCEQLIGVVRSLDPANLAATRSAAPLSDPGQFGLIQREELFDLERRKRFRKSLGAEVAVIPTGHPHLYGSVSNCRRGGKNVKSRQINGLSTEIHNHMNNIKELLNVTFCTPMTRTPL